MIATFENDDMEQLVLHVRESLEDGHITLLHDDANPLTIELTKDPIKVLHNLRKHAQAKTSFVRGFGLAAAGKMTLLRQEEATWLDAVLRTVELRFMHMISRNNQETK
jgi:hypothetical protein